MKNRTLTLIPNEAQGLFNAAAEPTLEVLTGKDSFNQSLAAGDQAADLLDGDRDARLTVNTNGVATVFHLDAALDRRLRVDRVILDGHTLRKAYGDDVGNLVKVLYNSTDNYGTATEAAIARVQSRLLGRGAAYLNFNGVTNVVTVSDDVNIDFGQYISFSLEAIIKVDTAQDGGIIDKRVLAGNFHGYVLSLSSDGKIHFVVWNAAAAGGGDARGATMASAATVDDGEEHHILCVCDRYVGMYIYIDGVESVSNSIVTTAADISNSKDLSLGAQDPYFFLGILSLARIWNRALSADEAAARYAGWTHTPIPIADQGASQTNKIIDTENQDFRGGTIGDWIYDGDGNGTVVYDGVSPSAEKTAKLTLGADAGTNNNMRLPVGFVSNLIVGKRYRYKVRLFMGGASTFTSVILRFYDGTTNHDSAELVGNDKNAWFVGMIEFIATDSDPIILQVRTIGGATGTGVLWADDLVVAQSGCVAEYAPEGISPTHGKLHDKGDNNLHGTISGAEARNVPSGDEGEVLLIELEQEIDARYLFIKINLEGLTGDANALFGQILLGRAAALTGVREFSEELGYPGIDTFEAYGGSELPSVRYEGERREWPLHLVAQGDTYPDGIYRAYKAAKGTKKVPLYLVEDITWNDGTGTRLIYCVKFDAPLRRSRTGKYHEIKSALREVAGP